VNKGHNYTRVNLNRLIIGLILPFMTFTLTSSTLLAPELPFPSSPKAENETNFKFKSLFCWKFINFIEWPNSYQQGNFEIAVLGDSPIQKYFKEWESGRKVNLQSIVVKKYSNSSSLQKPHILYIPKERSKDIGSVVKKLAGKSTLIITEQDGMANRGSMINFILVNSRVRFEINKGNVEKFKLMLSSTLLELSTKVIDK
jgi:YfiR/HmsC-like